MICKIYIKPIGSKYTIGDRKYTTYNKTFFKKGKKQFSTKFFY